MSESTPLDLTSKIPLAVTSEILLKLPAESVVRSRYVSKLWSSITTDPYFTNTFETRSSTRPSLLVPFKKKGKLFVFSFPQQNNKKSNEPQSHSSQHVKCYQMKYHKNCSFSFTESLHGLICFRESVTYTVVWNPSTRQLVTLPKPGKKWKGNLIFFLGYDPTECRVLTLGSAQESWRTVKTKHNHLPCRLCHERCINSVLYYHAYLDDTDNFIMSFDVRTEKFEMINDPSDDYRGKKLIAYEGKLACIGELEREGIILWILEDAKSTI